MATFLSAVIGQGTAEIRTWTADFTDDLPTGITVTAGTATHTPPYGSSLTPTMTASSPYLQAQLGAGLVAGQHYLDILATFSDGQKSSVKISFWVDGYATGMRSTMADLVAELRGMTDASPSDYTVAGIPYWSDKQLQDILDRKRANLKYASLEPRPDYSAGTVIYKDYAVPAEHIEGGTAFEVLDYHGDAFGTSTYSFDAVQGIVSFTNDVKGSAIYCNAHVYDLPGAAADVWRRKAAHYASAYDIITDNHNLSRSQLIKQCQQAATMYDTLSGPNTIHAEREDNVATWW